MIGHGVGHLRYELRQGFLGNLGKRARRDVVDLDKGRERYGSGLVCGGAPRVNVHGHSGGGQLQRQMADIDVHAASVAAAGLFERGSVEGKHGNTPNLVHSFPPCLLWPGRLSPQWS